MPNTPHDDFRPDMDLHETLTPFDAMEQTGKRAMLLLLLTFVSLLIVAFTIFKIYQPGVRDRSAPPTISADNTPFKVELDDPGGEVTPDQDKEIYKAMDGSPNMDGVVTTPKVEDPISLPKTANISVEPTVPTGTSSTPPAREAVVQNPKTAPKATPQVSTPAQSAPTGRDSNSVVQLASLRSRGEAEELWNVLNTRHRNLLRPPLYADIRRADLEAKGTFYRLRVAGLASESEAKKLCDALKGQQQACFVASK